MSVTENKRLAETVLAMLKINSLIIEVLLITTCSSGATWIKGCIQGTSPPLCSMEDHWNSTWSPKRSPQEYKSQWRQCTGPITGGALRVVEASWSSSNLGCSSWSCGACWPSQKSHNKNKIYRCQILNLICYYNNLAHTHTHTHTALCIIIFLVFYMNF